MPREDEETELLEEDQLIGSPDGWNLSIGPEGWSRERNAEQGEPSFMDVNNPGGWDD